MDAREVAFQIAKLDSMLERVDKVCGRERDPKPLRPDVSYPRHKHTVNARPMVAAESKPPPRHHVSRLQRDTGYSVIASGELAGNEMRLGDCRPQLREDDDPTGVWASFESDFDDMVAGMH